MRTLIQIDQCTYINNYLSLKQPKVSNYNNHDEDTHSKRSVNDNDNT